MIPKVRTHLLNSVQWKYKVLVQLVFDEADLETVTVVFKAARSHDLASSSVSKEVLIFVFCLPFHSEPTNQSCAPRSSLKTSTPHTQSSASTLQDNAWHCSDVIPERPWWTKKHPLTGGEIINRLLLLLLFNEGLHNRAASVCVCICF